MSDAIKILEEWVHGKKERYVSNINIGDGYGATCWEVTIGNCLQKTQVHAAEASFFTYKEEDVPENVVIVMRKDEDGWPGLSRTIIAAVEKANELGL